MFYIHSFHSFQTCTYFSWIFNVPCNKKKTTTPEAACKTPILGILYTRQNMKENLSRNEKRVDDFGGSNSDGARKINVEEN